jgi:predicted Fe-S protein YdhL (DUF1289 family)
MTLRRWSAARESAIPTRTEQTNEGPMTAESPKPSSPCIKQCVLAACQAICTGCGRTRDEIATWGRLSEERRSEIMATLPDRARWLGIGIVPKTA